MKHRISVSIFTSASANQPERNPKRAAAGMARFLGVRDSYSYSDSNSYAYAKKITPNRYGQFLSALSKGFFLRSR